MNPTRRMVVSGLGLAVAAFVLSAGSISSAAPKEKEQTVTLEIRGMTWGGCAGVVRSALEAVKGVKEAKVSIEKSEAVVKYDPDKVKVEDLIKAVKEARSLGSYDAKVKGK